MVQKFDFISNNEWRKIFDNCFKKPSYVNAEYVERLNYGFSFRPDKSHVMTTTCNVFSPKKAAAMYMWYKTASRFDKSITKYFDEYKGLTDFLHPAYNSNYGFYAYSRGEGLDLCVNRLIKNSCTRQACFCINNNNAMSDTSIDKLCTNTIHFFIRNDTLIMNVQMRSSNFLTLLPYDAFMFSVFYAEVYYRLKTQKYKSLRIGRIYMQIASLHYYVSDFSKYEYKANEVEQQYIDFKNPEKLYFEFYTLLNNN